MSLLHSRAVSVAANLYRRTANGRPYGSVISKRPIIVGASIARPVLGVFLIRIKASSYLFCRCPTGDTGKCRFCTRVLFHIAADFHRRTSDARPYELWIFAAGSFRDWKHKDNFHYHRSRHREKRYAQRHSACECKNDNCHCYRSGIGNNDYLRRCNDGKISASAKTTIAIVTGRADAITTI